MMMRKLICIMCPIGCEIQVTIQDKEVIEVKGNLCPRGKDWAIKEVRSPQRTVISVVKVIDGELPVVPVKTTRPIPKDKIHELMREIAKVTIRAPVSLGQVILEKPLGLDVAVVATREIKRKDEDNTNPF